MKSLAKLVLSSIILLVSYNSVLASVLQDSEVWYILYVSGKKIGYVQDKVIKTKYHNSEAYLYEYTMHMSMSMQSCRGSAEVYGKVYLDTEFSPLEQSGNSLNITRIRDSITHNTSSYNIVYHDTHIDCEHIEDLKVLKTVIPISKGIDLQTCFKMDMGVSGFKIGEIHTAYTVDVDKMQLVKKKWKIMKSTEIDGGKRLNYDIVDYNNNGQIVQQVYEMVPTTQEDALKEVEDPHNILNDLLYGRKRGRY